MTLEPHLIPEDLLHAVFESMSSGVLVLNEEGTVQLMNTAAAQTLQLFDDIALVINRPLSNIIPQSDVFLENTSPGEQQQVELTLSDGMKTIIGFSMVFIPNTTDRVIVFREVGRLLEAESRRQRSEQLAHVGEMVARLSHEIKNPLASILAGLHIIESDNQLSDNTLNIVKEVSGEVRALGLTIGQEFRR